MEQERRGRHTQLLKQKARGERECAERVLVILSPQNPGRTHPGPRDSGRATSLNPLQSPEAGPRALWEQERDCFLGCFLDR